MIDAFNSTSRFLYDLLDIGNTHFKQMISRMLVEPLIPKQFS